MSGLLDLVATDPAIARLRDDADAPTLTVTAPAAWRPFALAELARATAPVWEQIDALLLPTAPTIYRVAELEAEPILLNSRLGT